MTIIIVPTETCNFRCTGCLREDTKILMADWSWKPISEIKRGDFVLGCGKSTKLEKAKVTELFKRRDKLYELKTETGTLYITEEHPILTKHMRYRSIGQKPVQIGKEVKKSFDVILYNETVDYVTGYLSGAIHGDGTVNTYHYEREWGIDVAYRFRFAVKDDEFMERVGKYLDKKNFKFNTYPFRIRDKTVNAIYRNSKKEYEKIEKIISFPETPSDEWYRGFVAGFFDAEGSICTQATVRVANKDLGLLKYFMDGMKKHGFNTILEEYPNEFDVYHVRLVGGIREKIRFVQTFDLSITRKKDKLLNHENPSYEKIVSIKENVMSDVYNLETETHNYIAEGFIVHNCFEPTEIHEGVGIKYSYEGIKNSLMKVWGGPYRGSDVCLHGGEPLMTPIVELEKLMKLIYNLPWKDGKVKGSVSIVTNGSLITQNHVDLFKKYNVHVGLSCDGPTGLNIHRGPDPKDADITHRYNLNMESLITGLRKDGINVAVMCILHKENAGDIDKLKKLGKWMMWLKKHGITGGRMNPMYSNRHPELELTSKQLYWAWRNIYQWNKEYGLRWNPVIEMEGNLKREKGGQSYFFPKPCVYHRCNPFNTKTLSIHPDGTIGCCDRTFDHGLFVRSTDQKKCGRYEALEQLDCKGCKYWEICGGACPEEGIGGDWRKKTRFCEAIYQTYDYIAEQNNISFTSTQKTIEQQENSPHGDAAHGDAAHGDSTHGDSAHGDSAHGDMAHGDSTHGDNPDYGD